MNAISVAIKICECHQSEKKKNISSTFQKGQKAFEMNFETFIFNLVINK